MIQKWYQRMVQRQRFIHRKCSWSLQRLMVGIQPWLKMEPRREAIHAAIEKPGFRKAMFWLKSKLLLVMVLQTNKERMQYTGLLELMRNCCNFRQARLPNRLRASRSIHWFEEKCFGTQVVAAYDAWTNWVTDYKAHQNCCRVEQSSEGVISWGDSRRLALKLASLSSSATQVKMLNVVAASASRLVDQADLTRAFKYDLYQNRWTQDDANRLGVSIWCSWICNRTAFWTEWNFTVDFESLRFGTFFVFSDWQERRTIVNSV